MAGKEEKKGLGFWDIAKIGMGVEAIRQTAVHTIKELQPKPANWTNQREWHKSEVVELPPEKRNEVFDFLLEFWKPSTTKTGLFSGFKNKKPDWAEFKTGELKVKFSIKPLQGTLSISLSIEHQGYETASQGILDVADLMGSGNVRPKTFTTEMLQKFEEDFDRGILALKKHFGEPNEKNISLQSEDEALKLLRLRYAKGEISKEKFEQIKKTLTSNI